MNQSLKMRTRAQLALSSYWRTTKQFINIHLCFTKLDKLVIISVHNKEPEGALKLEKELESIFNNKIDS